MSEYLSKKAVLEWFGLMHLEYSHNAAVSEFIESGIEIFESGAFDTKDDLDEIIRKNHSLAVKMKVRTLELEDEIQRLRAALGHIHAIAQSELDELQYESQRKTWEEILLTAEEALKGDGNDA